MLYLLAFCCFTLLPAIRLWQGWSPLPKRLPLRVASLRRQAGYLTKLCK